MKRLAILALALAAATAARAMTVAEYLAIRYDSAIDNAAKYPALEAAFLDEAVKLEVLGTQLRPWFNAPYNGPELAQWFAAVPAVAVPAQPVAVVAPQPAPVQAAIVAVPARNAAVPAVKPSLRNPGNGARR